MNLKRTLLKLVNRLIKPVGFQIVRVGAPCTGDGQAGISDSGSVHQGRPNPILVAPSYNSMPLPEGAEAYLRLENPALLELEKRYQTLSHAATRSSLWTDQFQKDSIQLRYFRGDNAYVWQYRGENHAQVVEMKYLLTAYYIQKNDRNGLLDRLGEDAWFGIYTFDFNGKLVSRDLLDSIAEINFLEDNLGISGISGLSVLDIGAGYGRLAYRMASALPNLGRYYCTDAIAASTFVSDYYIRFRNIADKVAVIPLDEIEQTLQAKPVHLAVNVHSFSECTIEAIGWWLDLLVRRKVRYLFIVPNQDKALVSRETDGRFIDFEPLLKEKGYRLKVCEPKYHDPSVQKNGIQPGHHYLFEQLF